MSKDDDEKKNPNTPAEGKDKESADVNGGELKIDEKKALKGITKDPINKLVVQKSMPMLLCPNEQLPLFEAKMIDLFHARINSGNPDKDTVIVTKRELEELLGISYMKMSELDEKVTRLMKMLVDVPDMDDVIKRKKDREWIIHFTKITIFQSAVCRENAETGKIEVIFKCTPAAKRYIFNVGEVGYIKYKLLRTIRISSIYSYRMFCYIEKNRYDKKTQKYRDEWEVGLEELKRELGCSSNNKEKESKEENKAYEEYKIFNNRILKKAQKEIAEKAGYHYDYSPIREGRKVSRIRIKITRIDEMDEIEGLDDLRIKKIIDADTIVKAPEEDDGNLKCWVEEKGEKLNPDAFKEPLKPYGFNDGQLEEIKGLLNEFPVDRLPKVKAGGYNRDNIAKAEYIKLKMQRFEEDLKTGEGISYESENGVKKADAFTWLMGQISSDLEEVKEFAEDCWQECVKDLTLNEKQLDNVKTNLFKVPLYKLPNLGSVKASEDCPGKTALARQCFVRRLMLRTEGDTPYKRYCHLVRMIKGYQKDDGNIPVWTYEGNRIKSSDEKTDYCPAPPKKEEVITSIIITDEYGDELEKLDVTSGMIYEAHNDGSFKTLLSYVKAFCRTNVNEEDYARLVGIYNIMEKDFLSCEAVLEYAVSSGDRGYYMDKIEKTAMLCYREGFETHGDVERLLTRQKHYELVRNALGIKTKRLALSQRERIDKWFEDMKFGEEPVLEACKRAMDNADKPFLYADKILAVWHGNDVKTMGQIKEHDRKWVNGKPKTGKPNRFNDFDQRDTDFEATEILLQIDNERNWMKDTSGEERGLLERRVELLESYIDINTVTMKALAKEEEESISNELAEISRKIAEIHGETE